MLVGGPLRQQAEAPGNGGTIGSKLANDPVAVQPWTNKRSYSALAAATATFDLF